MKRFHPTILTVSLLCCAAPIVGNGVAIAAVQADVNDEATLDAHRAELLGEIAVAERAGSISQVEATRFRQSLDKMVRSARHDPQRPPHTISPARNATYRRTIANVEAALARSATPAAEGLIVAYSSGDAGASGRVRAEAAKLGLAIGFDLPRMSRITVTGIDPRALDQATAAFRSVRGVVSVERDREATLQTGMGR